MCNCEVMEDVRGPGRGSIKNELTIGSRSILVS
jgi:hypothetical protein